MHLPTNCILHPATHPLPPVAQLSSAQASPHASSKDFARFPWLLQLSDTCQPGFRKRSPSEPRKHINKPKANPFSSDVRVAPHVRPIYSSSTWISHTIAETGPSFTLGPATSSPATPLPKSYMSVCLPWAPTPIFTQLIIYALEVPQQPPRRSASNHHTRLGTMAK